MTTIAQNDPNLLRILNFWVKKYFQTKDGSILGQSAVAKVLLKCLGLLLSVTKSQKWAKSSVFMSISMF